MGTVKALLVGVSESPGLIKLPLCKNDIVKMKDALIRGINVSLSDIRLCGESGRVDKKDFFDSLDYVLNKTNQNDIFILYFSGHGGKNCLSLSDSSITFQSFVDRISQKEIKNKIVILDSCHSGSFTLNNTPEMDIDNTIDYLSGRGFAVMASCRAEQCCGFNEDRKMSLYTSFVYDALTSRYLIRKGKKSLEAINEAVFHFADVSNKKHVYNFQQPIFRSSIVGTIFFDVEDYNPYKITEVYEETDKYIIYSVEPVHAAVKRLSIKVILRFQSSMEQIAEIATEIKNKALYYEVHQNENQAARFKGLPASIVWCYFGYDEDDMVDGNYFCYTTWVDDNQDKSHWYAESKNATMLNGVFIKTNDSYNLIKSLKDKNLNQEEYIRNIKK